MEHSADSEDESEASAAGDHSDLELDSSDALHSSTSHTSLSRCTRTDSEFRRQTIGSRLLPPSMYLLR